MPTDAPQSAPPAAQTPAIEKLGDSAWLVRLGDRLDPVLNARVHALARWIGAQMPLRGIELVPAFASIALHFDPARIPGEVVRIELEAALARFLDDGAETVGAAPARVGREGNALAPGQSAERASRTHEIAVAYGGEQGPDLVELARHAGLGPEEVVQRHVATEFQVAMLGFQPGFPYLLGLDPALAMPRLANPRARVPAGSVGIGGAQCGIYPRTSPGGWRLIGRTAAVLFDPGRDPPALLAAGDRVRFRAVDEPPID